MQQPLTVGETFVDKAFSGGGLDGVEPRASGLRIFLRFVVAPARQRQFSPRQRNSVLERETNVDRR